MPEGTGRVNPKGLDFYSRLVDELLENGIAPNATLFHWDLPAALDDRGGWLNRDIAHWFADYAEVMFKALDDRVPRWATLNEPWVVTDGGYLHGALAPGHRSKYEAPIAAHNLMRASGAGIQAYRAHGKHEIGVVFNIEPKYPALGQRRGSGRASRAHAYMNQQFADPALLGSYPPELKEIFGDAWPDFPARRFQADEAEGRFCRHQLLHARRGEARSRTVSAEGRAGTSAEQDLYRNRLGSVRAGPDRYADLVQGSLRRHPAVHHRKRLGVLRSAGGRRRRAGRSAAYRLSAQAPQALHHAIEAGVNLKGYYAWSLMDNLEWSLGFSKRFGLYHVDFATQQRTPKATAKLYARVIESNGAVLDEAVCSLIATRARFFQDSRLSSATAKNRSAQR
jgi:beta-glucosidase